jgi:hypothetical protein
MRSIAEFQLDGMLIAVNDPKASFQINFRVCQILKKRRGPGGPLLRLMKLYFFISSSFFRFF